MNQLLAQLLDIGGPAFLLAIAIRFWPQFQSALTLGQAAALNGRARVRTFASRTVVIITRPIWFVILPVMYVATIASTISALLGITSFGAAVLIIAALLLKVAAVVTATVVANEAFRVQHIGNTTGMANQNAVNNAFGRPWLFVPMIVTAIYSLALLDFAMLVDTWMLADAVSYFHSLLSDMLFLGVLVFLITLVGAGIAAVAAFGNLGIDLGGGGWNGLLSPMLRVLPFITADNLANVQLTDAQRKRWHTAMANLLRNNWFAVGVLMVWVLFSLAFHSPLAWLIELALIGAWIAAMLAWLFITQEPRLDMVKRVVMSYLVVGVVLVNVRVIDACVPARAGETAGAVMFYGRFQTFISDALGFLGASTPAMIGFFVLVLALGIGLAVMGHKLHDKHSMLSHLMLRTGTPITVIALCTLLFQCGWAAYHYDQPVSGESAQESPRDHSGSASGPHRAPARAH